MSDAKISALPASTTPLAGTEVLPIVQSSTTKKVSIANLTAGRTVRVSKLESDDGVLGRWVIEQGGVTNNLQSATTGFGDWKTATIQANPSGRNMTWDAAGNTTVGVGNLVIGTAGKGIDFSADPSAAGMTSELLDDYEEGTWTPVVKGSTDAGTATYGEQKGSYTKVGRMVFFTCSLNWNTHTGTGDFLIDGLPFATSGLYQSTADIGYTDISFTAGSTPMIRTGTSSTLLYLAQLASGGGSISGIPIIAAGTLLISGTYVA